ncbi:MAG: Ig-like domain-containing protein [Thermoplasmata archaeon]|nr:Ig-like domain-containing protein [Thermoplasmata archaeon]
MDLANGYHEVAIVAFDNYGNNQTFRTNFTVDVEYPQLEILEPEDDLFFNTTKMKFSWIGFDLYSGIANYLVRIDQKEWVNVGTETTYEINIIHDGEHTFDVSALDNAYNSNITSITFTIDVEDPTLQIIFPPDGLHINETGILVEWRGEDSLSGIAWSRISINGADFINSESNGSHELIDLPEGLNRIVIRYYDKAGNFIEKSVKFHIDTIKPQIISNSPTGDRVDKREKVVVEFSEKIEISHFNMDIGDIQGGIEWDNNTMTFTPFSSLKGGSTIEVLVTGQDMAGNRMDPFSWAFTVDNSARIFGILLDDKGNSIGEVNIFIGEEEVGITDPYGEFDLNILPGDHTIIFKKDGYKDLEWSVSLAAGGYDSLSGINMEREGADSHEPDDKNEGFVPILIALAIILLLITLVVIFVIVRARGKEKMKDDNENISDPFKVAEETRSKAEAMGIYISHFEGKYDEALGKREEGDHVGADEIIRSYNDNITQLISTSTQQEDAPLTDALTDDRSGMEQDVQEPPFIPEEGVFDHYNLPQELERSDQDMISEESDEDILPPSPGDAPVVKPDENSGEELG